MHDPCIDVCAGSGRKLSGLGDATNTAHTKVVDGVVEEELNAAGQAGDSTLGGVQQLAQGTSMPPPTTILCLCF